MLGPISSSDLAVQAVLSQDIIQHPGMCPLALAEATWPRGPTRAQGDRHKLLFL